MLIEFVILLCLFILFYTYAGFPVLLFILSNFYKISFHKSDITPSVSFIISAHNEEKVIREKLENSLNLDYPKHLIKIFVASDASDDNTNKIAKEFKNRGVTLFESPEHEGKKRLLK